MNVTRATHGAWQQSLQDLSSGWPPISFAKCRNFLPNNLEQLTLMTELLECFSCNALEVQSRSHCFVVASWSATKQRGDNHQIFSSSIKLVALTVGVVVVSGLHLSYPWGTLFCPWEHAWPEKCTPPQWSEPELCRLKVALVHGRCFHVLLMSIGT